MQLTGWENGNNMRNATARTQKLHWSGQTAHSPYCEETASYPGAYYNVWVLYSIRVYDYIIFFTRVIESSKKADRTESRK